MRKNSIITKDVAITTVMLWQLDLDHASYKLQLQVHLRVIRELRKRRGIMATKLECDPVRIEAIKEVFRKNFDKIRTRLQSDADIKALNSKLFSRGLITDGVRSKVDIDVTLRAIHALLQDADVTEHTFTQFCDAVYEISTHLKTMLSKALRMELKEEQVVSQNYSYATPAISEHSQTTDSFASGNLPGPTVPLSDSGTMWTKEPADMTARRDSALHTNSVTDGEELPSDVTGAAHQVTDRDDPTVLHMNTASGTWPTLESNLRARVLELEKLVSELEETIEQLEQDKKVNLKLACDISTDTGSHLNKTLECLHLEQETAKELRKKLISLKKERLYIEQEYKLLLEQEKENTRMAEEAAEKRARLAWETASTQVQSAKEEAAKKVRQAKIAANSNVRLVEEKASEQVRQAKEEANEKVRLAVEKADEQVRQAKEEADEKVRFAEENAAKQVRLAEMEANEKVKLAGEEADKRISLKTEEHAQAIKKHRDMCEHEKVKTREAEDRAGHAEKEIERYQEEAERFAKLQRFVEQHLRITGEKLNSIKI